MAGSKRKFEVIEVAVGAQAKEKNLSNPANDVLWSEKPSDLTDVCPVLTDSDAVEDFRFSPRQTLELMQNLAPI